MDGLRRPSKIPNLIGQEVFFPVVITAHGEGIAAMRQLPYARDRYDMLTVPPRNTNMLKIRRLLMFAIACCLLTGTLSMSGCSDARPAEVQKRRDNLTRLAELYLAYAESHQSAPKNASDFLAFINTQSPSQSLTAAKTVLEEGDIVMIWEGDLSAKSNNQDAVLAFEARVPASGGYVVTSNGTVLLMTGKDFSEATMLPSITH